jgi:phosphatidylglycerophosphate synthase
MYIINMWYKCYKWYLVQCVSIMRPLSAIIIYFIFSLVYLRCLFFIILFFTDFLDGYLARRWKVTSRFGSILDPICDKVSIYVLFLCFSVALHQTLLFTIIFKDILVLFGGLYTQNRWKMAIITPLGKSTMVFIGIYLGSLIFNITNEVTVLNFNFNRVALIRYITNIMVFSYIIEYIYRIGVVICQKKE